MVVVCQQPNYFPWLGYIEQCARADVLVVLDSVQWIRQGRQHRARILPHNNARAANAGDFQWLTLPVRGHGHRGKPLGQLELDDSQDWREQHWRTVRSVYGRRPFFKTQVEPLVGRWFETAPRAGLMAEAALSSLKLCLETLGIGPELARSSELPERGAKTERLISLCEALGADTYYSALGSTRYVDVSLFRAAGIRLLWQHWKHPEYDQGRPTRRTHLSFIDAVANVPLDEIRAWLAPSPAFER
jgi:hypothetical protein